MAQPTGIRPHLLSIDEIREFGDVSNPCVTIFLPARVPGGVKRSLTARMKAAARTAEEKLGERSVVSTLVRRIVDPIDDLAGRTREEMRAEAVAIFASDRALRYYPVSERLPETIIVADNFYIRPFLERLDGEPRFYLLALSQKDVRLLRCTEHSSEEVDTGSLVPRSVREFTDTEKPDHVLDNRITTGPASGASKGVMFATGTDRESRDEYLLHFFKAVSRGVSDFLRGEEKTPLVVCGVEHELVLYQRVNTWQNTCPAGVRGAPNGLKGGDMHAQALECLKRYDDVQLEQLLAQHDRQAREAATAGVNDVVKAAYEGRVLHLFAASNATAMGSFDEATHRARTHQVPRSGDEDLINAAALQTILHAGTVHVMPQGRVPGNRPLAAIMRY